MHRHHPGKFLSWMAAFLCAAATAQAQTAPIRILPLGDSITAGWGGDANQGGYRAPLAAALTAAGYNVNYIGTSTENSGTMAQPQHEGHSGWHISGISSNIQAWLAAVDNPDVVLLHIGTNDFGSGDNTATAIDRLDGLITQIATQRPFAHIIVTTLMVRDEPYNSQIQSLFNPYVQAKVTAQAALGRRVTFLDMHAVVPLADMPDSLHPNQTGYNLMTNAWLSAIQAVCGPDGDASPPAIASVTGTLDHTHVSITFSKPVTDAAATLANYALSGGLTRTAAVLDASKRVVTLTTSPQAVGTSYTVTVNGVVDRTAAGHPIQPNSTAAFLPAIARGYANNVPESAGYSLVYSLDIPTTSDFSISVPYAVDNHVGIGAFSRVAYYLELQAPDGDLKYVWASMNAFTTDAGKIGVPSTASGAVFQQAVSSMNVVSNVAGVVTGTGLAGNLEFWPTNYSAGNSAGVPGASDSALDFGDTNGGTGPYGSMQLHQAAALQTVFAFNNWGGYGGNADIGIGNNPGPTGAPDWTFTGNANGYSVKSLQVLVNAVAAWTNAAGGSWNTSANWSGNIIPNAVGANTDFSTLDLTNDATVTLDGSKTVGQLNFGDTTPSNNWSINTGSGGPLTLALGSGMPAITVNNQTAAINATLAGTQGLAKNGAGTLLLTGTNSYTGATMVNEGTLRIGAANATCGSNSAVTLANVVGAGLNLVYWDGNAYELDSTGTWETGQNVGAHVSIGSLAGGGVNGGSIELCSGVLTVGGDNTSTTYAGSIYSSQYWRSNPNGVGALTKVGTGTLTLSGLNHYNGATTVSQGALQVLGSLAGSAVTVAAGSSLGGTGTLGGPVTVTGTLAPGTADIGTLTISNTLTAAGTVAMRIGKSGATCLNDQVKGISTLNCGGALVVTNPGAAALVAGDVFRLFVANSYNGGFSGITLPPLDSGLIWDTSNLTYSGIISVTAPVVGNLPAGWAGSDVGTAGLPGTASCNGAAYGVSGSGAAIGGTTDAFQFSARTLAGDGEIQARVTSQSITNGAAMAGVMMRSGSGAGAVNALVALTPNGFTCQARTTANGPTTTLGSAARHVAPDNWLRLLRIGTTVTAYVSADGNAWLQLGSCTLPAGTLSVGLAVTSHDNTALSTVTYDHVVVIDWAATTAFQPVLDNRLLINPGKGFVEYWGPTSAYTNDVIGVGYNRCGWSTLEPTEGVYNWDWVDNLIAAYAAYGRKFAFGVINTDPGCTPDWVFQPGTNATTGTVYPVGAASKVISDGYAVPVTWDEPVYLARMKAFIKALGEHYNGNPNIAYIDVRNYGRDGEGNGSFNAAVKDVSAECLKNDFFKPYVDAFPNRQLIALGMDWLFRSVFEYEVTQGVGRRIDGICYGVGNASECMVAYPYQPAVLEYWAGYPETLALGYGDTATLMTFVNGARPSYLQFQPDYYNANKADAAMVGNKIGYHFVLQQANLPATIQPGVPFQLNLQWLNDGVAPLYEPCSMAVALLDDSNNVVQKQWLAGSNPQSWMPDVATTEAFNVTFPSVPSGYKLAIGLFTSQTDADPAYQLGVQGRVNHNWYVLSGSATMAASTWTNPAGGAWNTLSNWTGNSTHSGVDVVADFSTLDLTANATVTLDGAITASSLVFGDTAPSHNWTLASGTGGSLTLKVTSGAPAPSITVTNQALTLNANLTGNQGLCKNGAGSLLLAGTNSYIGNTIVNGGVLEIASNSKLYSVWQGATVTVNSGGTLRINGWNGYGNGGWGELDQVPMDDPNVLLLDGGALEFTASWAGSSDRAIGLGSHGGTLKNSSTQAWTLAASGTGTQAVLTNNSGLTLDGSGTGGVVQKSITGSGTLTKTGTGTWTLSGSNTYSGATSVGAGKLTVSGSVSNTSGVVVAAGSALEVSGTLLATGDITNNGTLTFTGTAQFSAGGTITNNGTIYNNSPSLVLPANIVNNGTIYTNLNVPAGLAATAGNAQVSLSWSAVAGATSYRVKRATVSGGPYTLIASPTTTALILTGLTNGTPYYYVVSAASAAGASADSAQVSATPVAAGPLPSPPWAKTDVGTVGTAGTSGYAGSSSLVVSGAGAGINNAADAFQFAYVSTTSTSYSVTARVTTPLTGTAKAGVMIRRDTTSARVRMVAVMLEPNGGNYQVRFASRTSTNGNVSWSSAVTGLTLPRWLKLTRASNNDYTGYVSSDGLTWTQVGTVNNSNISSTTAYAGLVVSSGSTSSLASETFDNVSVPGWTPPPNAPTGAAASTASQSQINLSWTAAGGATGYQVWRSTAGAGIYSLLGTPTGITYQDSGLPAGTSYDYLVRATSGSGTSVNSTVATATTWPTAPVITSGLSATGTTGVAFAYQIAGSNNPTSFSAVNLPAGLGVNTGTGAIIGTPSATGTSNVTIGATNAGGTGSATLVITVLPPPPAAPAGFTATAGNGQVALAWSTTPGATGYNLKRSPVSGGNYVTILSNTATTSYNDTGLTNWTDCYYVVSALNAGGEGANSGEVAATPQSPPISAVETGASSGIRITGGTGTVIFKASVAGHIYQLQFSDSLAGGTWTDYGTAQPGTGGELIFAAPYDNAQPRRFYRLQIQQ
jgi:autotransporter-associated beta strand protein